jgi:AraC-like DNA-binding protein
MFPTTEFLAQVADIDSRPETMFVQHHRSEENYPLHHHQKAQFAYVEEGLAYLVTPDKTYFLPARHYVWIPPRLEHRILFRSSKHLIHSMCFAEAVEENPFYTTLGIYPVTTLLYEMLRYTEDWYGHYAPEPEAPYLFLKNLKLVLPQISRHPLPIALPTSDDPRLLPVLAHIYHHLPEPLELTALASRFGFSLRNLSRLFQQRLHCSFSQYLKLRRVTAAMEQMLQTKQSVSEIAYAVGYNSLGSFSNAFYQLVGRRPSDFMPREKPRRPAL